MLIPQRKKLWSSPTLHPNARKLSVGRRSHTIKRSWKGSYCSKNIGNREGSEGKAQEYPRYLAWLTLTGKSGQRERRQQRAEAISFTPNPLTLIPLRALLVLELHSTIPSVQWKPRASGLPLENCRSSGPHDIRGVKSLLT